jgi:hypothetical protein
VAAFDLDFIELEGELGVLPAGFAGLDGEDVADETGAFGDLGAVRGFEAGAGLEDDAVAVFGSGGIEFLDELDLDGTEVGGGLRSLGGGGLCCRSSLCCGSCLRCRGGLLCQERQAEGAQKRGCKDCA